MARGPSPCSREPNPSRPGQGAAGSAPTGTRETRLYEIPTRTANDLVSFFLPSDGFCCCQSLWLVLYFDLTATLGLTMPG